MKLASLLTDVLKSTDGNINFTCGDLTVNGITDNTKEVAENYIFVCIKGNSFDGHSAAEEMLEKGALCVVTEYDLGLKRQIITSDTRKFYGLLCAAWFEHPERHLRLVGITGTNGKTTTATLIKDILALNNQALLYKH